MSTKLTFRFRNLTDAEDKWGRPSDFLRLIEEAGEVSVADPNADNFFTFGASTPGADVTDRPWVRLDGDGNPLGVFVYKDGEWISYFPVSTNQVFMFTGAVADIEPPFFLADGDNGTTDLTAQMTPSGTQTSYTVGFMQYRGYP